MLRVESMVVLLAVTYGAAALPECLPRCIGADLAGVDLSSLALANANLTGADLTGAHMAGTNLSRATLTGADLTYAYLDGADLTRAHMANATLRARLGGHERRRLAPLPRRPVAQLHGHHAQQSGYMVAQKA